MPIHIMLQPDYLTARVAALEDLELYVEDLAFAKILCEETRAVKRESPMKVHCLGALFAQICGGQYEVEPRRARSGLHQIGSIKLVGAPVLHAHKVSQVSLR